MSGVRLLYVSVTNGNHKITYTEQVSWENKARDLQLTYNSITLRGAAQSLSNLSCKPAAAKLLEPSLQFLILLG